MALTDFLWGLLVGGAPSLLIAGVLLWWLRRQRALRRPLEASAAPAGPNPPMEPAPEVPAAPVPDVPPMPVAGPASPPEPGLSTAAPEVPFERPPAEAEAPVPPRPEPEVARPSRRRAEPVPPRLRIPYRILLHVARQGRVGPNEVPPIALSQAGMVEALRVRQGAVAAALQRLVAAGLLGVERSHVQGGERRLKVYYLTPRGEELVRDLRRRGRGRG